MSFILDALKKAESERNRRVAPVLMDARIAPPRRGLPGWALALGIVLLVNLAVIAWLLLRTPDAGGTIAATGPSAAAEPSVTAPQPAQVATAPVATAPPPIPVAAGPTPVAPPPVAQFPVAPAPAAPAYIPPQADPETLPTLDELRYAGVPLPELQLNLHIYDPAPAHRSVLLNGQRLREGEYSPNGVKVERITPAGVVLEAGGRRFRLDAGG